MSHDELERAEEETGIDYDKDNEKGESAKHKAKMKKKGWKFKEWLKVRECGVPYVGQKADPGGEMSWQGDIEGGKLRSAKGDIPVKKKRAR